MLFYWVRFKKMFVEIGNGGEMKVFKTHLFRFLLVLPVAFALISAPVNAESIRDKVKDAYAELAEASDAVVQAQQDLAKTRTKMPAAQRALAHANGVEGQATLKYNRAAANLLSAQQAYALAKARVAAKQAEIVELQTKVNQFARAVYQQGQTSQWEIVLQSESPADLTSRMQTIKAVSQASAASLDRLLAAKVQLKENAAEAESERVRMQALETEAQINLEAAQAAQDEAALAKAKVDWLISQEAAAVASAEQNRKKEQRQLNYLLAEQIRLANLSNSGSQGTGDPQATGPLSWPVPGYAAGSASVQHVGPRVLSSGRYSCHTGQDIPAPTGANIVSSANGVVLFAGWNWGYGYMTLVDHGNGLVTAYTHQSRLFVKKGQSVVEGQHIGDVGNTGAFSAGAHLHYEVHVNGYNYDPMGWFGGSRKVVACAPTRGL